MRIVAEKIFWATYYIDKHAERNKRSCVSVPICLSSGLVDRTLDGTMIQIVYLLQHVPRLCSWRPFIRGTNAYRGFMVKVGVGEDCMYVCEGVLFEYPSMRRCCWCYSCNERDACSCKARFPLQRHKHIRMGENSTQ